MSLFSKHNINSLWTNAHWTHGHICPYFTMTAIIKFIKQQFSTFFFRISEKKKFLISKLSICKKKMMVKSQMQSDVASCLNLQGSCKSNLAWVKPAEYLHDYVKHFKSKFTSNQKT